MANIAQPGEYIVVLFGLSSGTEQSVCADGEIARVIMRTKSTEVISWGLGLGKATVSASDGKEMPTRTLPYQGRNSGTRNPVVAPVVSQSTTPEATAESGTASSIQTAEAISPLGPPALIPGNAGTNVRTTLAETRKVREEISKLNAVSSGQTIEEQALATQVATEKTDTQEPGKVPASSGVMAGPVENAGRARIEGGQVPPVTPKIENDRPKRTEEPFSESQTTQTNQHAGSSSGLWLVAGIGVLALLILVALFLTRK